MHHIREHLAWWGLKRLNSDAAYDRWQRESLSLQEITRLHELIEQKRTSPVADEAAFYDFTVRPHILPVLYSQRYEYYETIGPRVLDHLKDARSVLDLGCGPGILTTFYAKLRPDVTFVGIDRSASSVGVAQARAAALGLRNVQFDALDVEKTEVAARFDVILATHALVQSEADPGIPSVNWKTFARSLDSCAQDSFEQRTGLRVRLSALCDMLEPPARMILFEKTRQLARRVAFQRAVAARGFRLIEKPVPVRYRLIEEIADDGPFYVTGRGEAGSANHIPWDEEPERGEQDELYRCAGEAARWVWERLPERSASGSESWHDAKLGGVRVERGRAVGSLAYLYLTDETRSSAMFMGGEAAIDALHPKSEPVVEVFHEPDHPPTSREDLATLPLYENHTVAAQWVWSRLADRRIIRDTTLDGPEGRQMHVELGQVPHLIYLYWANTFDQRQLVMIEESRAHVLDQYYREFLDSR